MRMHGCIECRQTPAAVYLLNSLDYYIALTKMDGFCCARHKTDTDLQVFGFYNDFPHCIVRCVCVSRK